MLTPENPKSRDRFNVCTRIGASGDLLSASDSKFAPQTCIKIIDKFRDSEIWS